MDLIKLRSTVLNTNKKEKETITKEFAHTNEENIY